MNSNSKPLDLKLIEYLKGTVNPFTTYTNLAKIWNERKERAISSIERYNNDETTGKIYLIQLDNNTIGITGYYLINSNDDYAGLRWHGIVLGFQNKGYSHKALNLLIENIKCDKTITARFIQELLPYDKLETLSYFEKMGFINTDKEPKFYEEMPDIKCYKLVKSLY